MTLPPLNAVEQSRLDDSLARLREATRDLKAPAAVDERVLKAFRAKSRAAARPRLWWMPPLALAATVAATSWIARLPAVPAENDAPAAVSASLDDRGPFLALRPMERITLEPSARVIATEFPRVYLAQWGLPVAPERAGETVRAELLYSADGEALAVRFLDPN